MKIQRRSTLEYWAHIAEITSAVAVVVSVIYLGLQVRDNTKVLRSQSHYNALAASQQSLEIMIENEGLAKLVTVCFANPEALNADEWNRCGAYILMQFNAWEYMYYQHRDGSTPREVWSGADALFKENVASKPGYARFWSEYAIAFGEPFRSYVTQEFAKKPVPRFLPPTSPAR